MLIIIHGTSVSKCRYPFFGQISELCHFTICDGGELKLHAKHAGVDVRFSSVLVKRFNLYVL